ncbi:MAG: hypothetical protein DI626_01635 [Micavibrio aeruginosavorus]|uniref:Uncharacterized protein n=1 Tax=Micavibrio aeruginosavorus TaxID=349221 RepID=A0A2W5A1P6_9BACT|nr:MAG: hypothetical protein DI626_01635 [Micavibrio aeruginosavorus]
MREPKQTFGAAAATRQDIPDIDGAGKGLLGVKAPAGYRQTGDIQDRLTAAGCIKPANCELKK